jgi:hypothetical protein
VIRPLGEGFRVKETTKAVASGRSALNDKEESNGVTLHRFKNTRADRNESTSNVSETMESTAGFCKSGCWLIQTFNDV